ncbi:MAG: hypothetical protein IJ685_12900, partial [Selenomonadaceae bacterium]|nr:hypothetical protein [Selenomonadaceae bacterium]
MKLKRRNAAINFDLRQRCGASAVWLLFKSNFGSVIEKNLRLGLLVINGDKIFLTKRGMALGNEVFADFLL